MSILKKILQLTLLTINLSLTSFFSTAQKLIPPPVLQEDWSRDYEPFRICGNVYYVGTYDLACYLITTPQGHILINTGLGESVPMIRSHIEALGFRFTDIKILLATHTHFDHVGGMAEIKKLTGAKMMIHENDASVLADGGNSDYVFGGKGSSFQPVKPDRLLKEKDTVKLGGMEIVVLHHPGHTKGACSFLFTVKDEQRSYRVLIANMPSILDETKLSGMATYPDVAKDYGYTFDSMKSLEFDIWLSSHASQFGLHQKRKPGDGYHPEAFIDRQGFDVMLNNLENKYLEKLKHQ
ncbi:MAG TPA: subclass B3 metallo-beta-lactamase [Flavisolibacter sp.]|nr:subclass B3 metallo-beta-lactamase [Flavisolibacter sp.]